MNEQIKSKERVAEYGEVFTNSREVNAMLDLVKPETERIESRFLEPACGDGNFLAEILRRKLEICKMRYGRSNSDYELKSIVAISSLYGVDIMEDNAQECRDRLYSIWNDAYMKQCGNKCTDLCRDSVRFILSKNILCGDALSMKQNSGEPIIFAQWDEVMGGQIKRADYRLDELMKTNDEKKSQNSLFYDDSLEANGNNWVLDDETNKFIPGSIKEYPAVDYRHLKEVD